MPNDYFRFQQFTVFQGQCAMKVGTDGTLLGAWATGGSRILDVGTGTGLIALMMAQRHPTAQVTGIDIDPAAVSQAWQNVFASPFARRVSVALCDVQAFQTDPFDAIVCNPPYFTGALHSPDRRRTLARHTTSLSFRQLVLSARRLLADQGELSVIVPFDALQLMQSEAALAGFFLSRHCAVQTTPAKPPRRHLLAFRRHPVTPCAETLVIGSEPYLQLIKDFYLCV